MANNFSTIKTQQSSEKGYLIRMVPRRYVNDDLVLDSGTTYTMTFNYPISKITANDTELTLVAGTPTAGQYSYNETTGLLTINSVPSSSNIIIVWYYTFYTSTRHRVVTEDPENSSTTSRDWLPRISRIPNVIQTQENILDGTFSVNISSLALINQDNEFQDYLTDNDSWNKAEIKIWIFLNDVENIQRIFEGKITKLTVTETGVVLSIDDTFSNLLELASMGDGEDEIIFNLQDISTLNPRQSGLPRPFMFGTVTRYQLIPDTSETLTTALRVDPTTSYEAVNINYVSENPTTSNNRSWGLCRVSSDGFLDFSFTPSAVDNTNPSHTILTGTTGEIAKFHIGDTFEMTQGGTYYGRVLNKTSTTLLITKEASISAGVTVDANNCPTVIVSDFLGNDYYLLYGRDYTASTSATSGGNISLNITLVNNFEANHAGLTTLDPGVLSVIYRVKPDTTSGKHGDVLKAMVEASGLTVNSASVSAANTAFTKLANFSIPNYDEIDYKEYTKYIQDLLISTFGYITLNNDFEIEYHLFAAPTSTDEITNVDILRNSFKIDVNYQDIYNTIISINPHYSSSEAIVSPSDSPSVTETSLKSKYLHNIDNVLTFRHVLESINDRLSEMIKVRRERKAVYRFDTKLINIDNIIGDDILLNRESILGANGSRELKILSLNKSADKTIIIAQDLLDL